MQRLLLSTSQLDLPVVLRCGQSFRWKYSEAENEWRFALSDRVVALRQDSDALMYRVILPDGAVAEKHHGSTLEWIRDYFQLDQDIVKIFAEVDDPIFQDAASRFQGGIRMLRQDPWENLISFICSQNNHISRICSMVQKLATHFSAPLVLIPSLCSLSSSASIHDDEAYHPFPPPQVLAHPSVDARLRDLGFGYRAKYIQQTAAMLCNEHIDPQKWLLSLRAMTTVHARAELLRLPGVGPKVADCILLMSLDKREVVPIDTHMLQIAIRHYGVKGGKQGVVPPMTPKLHAEVSSKLQSIWGPYAGWAHSVLFTADLRAFSHKTTTLPSLFTPPTSPTTAGQIREVSPGSPLMATAGKRKRDSTTTRHTKHENPVLSPPPTPRLKRKRQRRGASLTAASTVSGDQFMTEVGHIVDVYETVALVRPDIVGDQYGGTSLAERVKLRRGVSSSSKTGH